MLSKLCSPTNKQIKPGVKKKKFKSKSQFLFYFMSFFINHAALGLGQLYSKKTFFMIYKNT